MKLVWVVRLEGRVCIHGSFKEAYYDFLSHRDYLELLPNPAWMYPKFMNKNKFENLTEFTGW